jgi:toxin YhaV
MNHPLIINGWVILAHPLFLEQIDSLVKAVEHLKSKDVSTYCSRTPTKKLAAIFHLAFKKIPDDPTLTEYRQGQTLGQNNKHWFRVKFFQQYRLFFRFHLEKKILIYVWVNDEKSKRAYDSKTDAYLIFKKMLLNGTPPNNWDDLLKEATDAQSIQRLKSLAH